MQYAKILVNHPLVKNPELTYAIPEKFLPEISFGSVVKVNLRNRTTLGLVVGFTKSAGGYNPLPLKNIFAKGSVITPKHLKYYYKIAEKSLCAKSEAVFYFLPKTKTNISLSYKDSSISALGKIKIIHGTMLERMKKYILLSKKYPRIIFIFPTKQAAEELSSNIKESYLLSSNTSFPKRWKIWEKISANKFIVCATRIGVGLVPDKKSIFVIDSPDHPGHKEDHKPRFNTSSLINLIRKRGDHIVLGSENTSYYLFYKYGFKTSKPNCEVELINSGGLTESVISKIKTYNRACIVGLQKEEWGLVLCKNCLNVFRCPDCAAVLSQRESANLICPKCLKVFPLSPCPICQGTAVKGFNMGLKLIAAQLKNTGKKLLINPSNNDDLNKDKIVVLTSHKILDFKTIKFDYLTIFGFDFLLDIPSLNQDLKIFSILLKLSAIAKKMDIITKRPLNRIFSSIAKKSYQKFYQETFKKKYPHYPPFSRAVKIKVADNKKLVLPKDFSAFKILDKNSTETVISAKEKDWEKLYNLYQKYYSSYKFDPDPRYITLY